ncbi:MAG: RnfABCDGE type electron transport complex subunit G [Candidatus Omnitrophica bacterium]|nr:RnfABCDGE type electron transport complex subunit G [Candidatus Omnitrophota bacterium]
MKNTIKMIIVLTVLGLLSGAALVFIYRYASPLIAQNQKDETEKAIYKIFPEGKNYDTRIIGEDSVYKVKDKNGKLLGYAFPASGNGYQGQIDMLVGIQPDLATLAGIEVLDSQETPGLGQEITTEKFENQFKGLKVSPSISYVKNQKPQNPNEIEAITGATVSSKAVVTILNERIAKIKKDLNK